MPKFNEAQGAWEPEEHEIDRAAEHEILLRHIGKAPAQPAPQPNPMLFHPDLVDREFGSNLLSVQKLTDWAAKQGLELLTQPPIERFQFVQVEALLCAIERAAMDSAPEPMAAAVVQATPHLAQNRAAEIAPRWLVSADAHQQWRRLLEKAIEAGELALLHFGSKLPVQVGSEPQAADPAPVVAESVPSDTANSLTTAQVAAIFDGLQFTAENWPKRLSGSQWLKPAQVALGAAGGATSLWNPATLARLIHGMQRGAAKQKMLQALNKKFKSNPVLEPWRADWNEHYEMFNDADERH